MTDYEPTWLLFASDADMLALAAAALLIAAVAALLMERRRHRRDRVGAPDRVGWMPWTTIFFVCAVIGTGLMAVALPGLLQT